MTSAALRRAAGNLRAGRMVVVVDDEERENEGDLVMAAEHVTAEAVNFMATHGRGLICVARRLAEAALPSRVGNFRLVAYGAGADELTCAALVHGRVDGAEGVLVRVHSACLTGDVFGSERCDCGEQLRRSLALIRRAGRGILLYLTGQEGRGVGIGAKILAYQLQDAGLDTVEANLELGFAPDLRDYRVAAWVLHDLGVRSVRLLSNNPAKLRALLEGGVEVLERLPLQIPPTRHSRCYLETKRDKLGHLLDLPGDNVVVLAGHDDRRWRSPLEGLEHVGL